MEREMIYFLYMMSVAGLLYGLIPILLSIRFKNYVRTKLRQPPGDYTPSATVIVPCKGTDLEFAQNILSILNQDYPEFEILFVTDSAEDPAHAVIKKIINDSPRSRAKLIVAEVSMKRAQKLTNILFAAQHASPGSEVIVHLDADVRLEPNFLRYLIAPLANESVGATSGFPWYVPRRGNAGSVLRSIWGGGALPLLIDNRHNFACGAANAIKKTTYYQADVPRAMNGTVSDTFAITRSVKGIGQRIEFVPQCLFITPDESSLIETIRWTNRQTVISRVNGPKFFWTAAVTYSLANALLLLGLVLLAKALLGSSGELMIPALLMLSVIPLQAVNASLLLQVIKTILPAQASELDALAWKYRLLAPIGSVLIFLNSMNSLTTNEIAWRGIRYRLVSSSQTEVISVGKD
jgi:ceramide glucosyltransferase